MIENKQEVSKDLEKALQALEQAKQRVANEKKKQNEKKRKVENHHKYIMGGIDVKYFPECYSYDEGELNRHIHVLLTMPPITENGECIPLIDKKTDQQKVDDRNHKHRTAYKESQSLKGLAKNEV